VRAAQAITAAAAALATAGVDSPRVDAEILAAFVLDRSRGQLLAGPPLTPHQLDRYRELVASRAQRVPLQHLTGRAPFRRLELQVGPGVFVPRPETELLVQWGLARLTAPVGAGPTETAARPSTGPVVVDLCAGAGPIAISVALEAPGSRVYAVEQDPAALAWLDRNAAIARAAGAEVIVVAADASAGGALAGLAGMMDLVLANPPYLPLHAAGQLPAEVARHDPPQALFAGPDGLTVIRALVPSAAALLAPGGAVGFEHDPGQTGAVAALFRRDGLFGEVELHHDLAGRPRFTTAIRTPAPLRVAH
jgi:release factor glutamine methyltransferase